MKVTSNWLTQHFPFLSNLLSEGKIGGRKRVVLVVSVGPVQIHPPFYDSAVRYTSLGQITGRSFTHFAGSDASVANNPAELLGSEFPFENQRVSPGCYYAQLDLNEYYGMRQIKLWLNAEDIKSAALELRNQLAEFNLR